MTQSKNHSFDHVNRAKAPACYCKPHSVSPLYPKAEALGFTGHSYNESKSSRLSAVIGLHAWWGVFFVLFALLSCAEQKTPAPSAQSIMPNPTTPAIRMALPLAKSPHTKSLLAWAQALVVHVRPVDSSYDHKPSIVTWAGVNGAQRYQSHTDCSGLLNALLIQTYGLTPVDFQRWLQVRRPLAKDFYAAIVAQQGFTRLTQLADVQPGDIIAIRYLNSAPGDNTGHLMLVASNPQARTATKPEINDTVQWDVAIIDSSESGHGKVDTRHLPDGTFRQGIGQGMLRIYTDRAGAMVGYTWSDFANSEYYDQQTRPLVVGRLQPQLLFSP